MRARVEEGGEKARKEEHEQEPLIQMVCGNRIQSLQRSKRRNQDQKIGGFDERALYNDNSAARKGT